MGRTEATIQEALGWADLIRDLGKRIAEGVSDQGGRREDLARIRDDRQLFRQMAALGMRQGAVQTVPEGGSLPRVDAVIPVRVNYDRKYVVSFDGGRRENVSLTGLTGERVVPLSVVNLGPDLDSEPVERALSRGGLRSAIAEEFDSFVDVVKAIPLTLPILACGSSWVRLRATDIPGDISIDVLCLDEDEDGRHALTRGWAGPFPPRNCRLLAAPL